MTDLEIECDGTDPCACRCLQCILFGGCDSEITDCEECDKQEECQAELEKDGLI